MHLPILQAVFDLPPTMKDVLEIAHEIRSLREIQPKMPSQSWLTDFLKRHPKLVAEVPTVQDAARKAASTKEVRAKWFLDLNATLQQVFSETDENGRFKYDELYIVDMDETSLDDEKSGERNGKGGARRISPRGFNYAVNRKESNASHFTHMTILGSDGKVLPSIFILERKTVSEEECKVLASNLPDALLMTSDKGSTTQELMPRIIQHIHDNVQKHFATRGNGFDVNRTKVLLTMDFPSCHQSYLALKKAKEELGMDIILKPSQSTSWSQPADNEHVHGKLKQKYHALQREARITKPTLADQLRLISQALKSLTLEDVKKAFTLCGFPTFDESGIVGRSAGRDFRIALEQCQQQVIVRGLNVSEFTDTDAKSDMIVGLEKATGVVISNSAGETGAYLKRKLDDIYDMVQQTNEQRQPRKKTKGMKSYIVGINATEGSNLAALERAFEMKIAEEEDKQDKKKKTEKQNHEKFAESYKLMNTIPDEQKVLQGHVKAKQDEVDNKKAMLKECEEDRDLKYAAVVDMKDRHEAYQIDRKARCERRSADEKANEEDELKLVMDEKKKSRVAHSAAKKGLEDAVKAWKAVKKQQEALNKKATKTRTTYERLVQKVSPQIVVSVTTGQPVPDDDDEDDDGDVMQDEWKTGLAAPASVGELLANNEWLEHTNTSIAKVPSRFYQRTIEEMSEYPKNVEKLESFLRTRAAAHVQKLRDHPDTRFKTAANCFAYRDFDQATPAIAIMLILSGKVDLYFDEQQQCILTPPKEWEKVSPSHAGFFGSYTKYIDGDWIRAGKASGENSDIHSRQIKHDATQKTNLGKVGNQLYQMANYSSIETYVGLAFHKTDETVCDLFHWSDTTINRLRTKNHLKPAKRSKRSLEVGAKHTVIAYYFEYALRLCMDPHVNVSHGINFETFHGVFASMPYEN